MAEQKQKKIGNSECAMMHKLRRKILESGDFMEFVFCFFFGHVTHDSTHNQI